MKTGKRIKKAKAAVKRFNKYKNKFYQTRKKAQDSNISKYNHRFYPREPFYYASLF